MKTSNPNAEISLIARLAAAEGTSYGQYVSAYETANLRSRKPKSTKPKRTYFRTEQRPSRECANCGALIQNPRYNQAYCSEKCRKQAKYLEWKSAHRDGNPE